MNIETKTKLLKYLFPTEDARCFLCDDLYMELNELIPKPIIVSSKNTILFNRKHNLNMVTDIVNAFLEENIDYKQKVLEIYKNSSFENIINDIVIGYTLFYCNSSYKYNSIDIFKDKRCICYSPISKVDIL